MNDPYYVSTDKTKLDIKMIFHFLNTDSYWAKGRSLEVIRRSIENSLCFGVYLEDEQVGFARVVTDYAVFGWILDVFVVREHRKKGLGKKLLSAIISHDQLRKLQKWGLATEDANGLYKKYGFQLVKNPEYLMELVFKPS